MTEFSQDLNALLDARFPVLVSETHEESRLLAKKRSLDPAALRMARLSELSEGYSGAEIEQASLRRSMPPWRKEPR